MSGHPQKERILAELEKGRGPSEIARELGVSKNTVIGVRARAGLCEMKPRQPPASTMFDRLDAMHAKLDRLLLETRPFVEDRVKQVVEA